MGSAKEKYKHFGESAGCADHDHDLVHELSSRLDLVWRYDQYMANAEGHGRLQDYWASAKDQELKNIRLLKSLVKEEINQDCF